MSADLVQPRATCWSIVRTNGTFLLGTTLDHDLVVTATGFSGTYSAQHGITAANVKRAADLSVNTTEAQGVLFALGATASDIEAGLYDEAAVTIFVVDYTAPSSVIWWTRGTLGQLGRDTDGNYTFEFRGLTQQLQNPISATSSRSCIAELGSGSEAPLVKRCGVDLTPYIYSGTVTSVTTANRAFADSGIDHVAGWFTYGKMTWVTGANAGFTRGVQVHGAGGSITLVEQLPYDIAVGDTYTMTPGCNKLYSVSQIIYARLTIGTVQVDSGTVTMSDISGTTSTSGSVTVSGTDATWTGNGTLTITSPLGTATVALSGTTITATDTNGTVKTIDTTVTTTVDGDCKTKFNNLPNFRGQPWLSGDDTLLRSQA